MMRAIGKSIDRVIGRVIGRSICSAMRGFIPLLAICMTHLDGAALPSLIGRVNDYAKVLTEPQRQSLEITLEGIEKLAGHPQVVILTTRDMGGMEIEEYSLAVARQWQIGQRQTDNGLLIVTYVAPGDAFRVRLEVGYGLEGRIPDATARAIYEQTMRSHFKKAGRENYMEAYTGALKAIESLLKEEPTGDPLIDRAPELETQSLQAQSILYGGLAIAFLVGFIHLLASGVVGGLTAVVLGKLLGFSLFALLPFTLLGFFAGIVAHIIIKTLLSGGVGLPGHSSCSGGGRFGGFSGGGGSFGGGGFTGRR